MKFTVGKSYPMRNGEMAEYITPKGNLTFRHQEGEVYTHDNEGRFLTTCQGDSQYDIMRGDDESDAEVMLSVEEQCHDITRKLLELQRNRTEQAQRERDRWKEWAVELAKESRSWIDSSPLAGELSKEILAAAEEGESEKESLASFTIPAGSVKKNSVLKISADLEMVDKCDLCDDKPMADYNLCARCYNSKQHTTDKESLSLANYSEIPSSSSPKRYRLSDMWSVWIRYNNGHQLLILKYWDYKSAKDSVKNLEKHYERQVLAITRADASEFEEGEGL